MRYQPLYRRYLSSRRETPGETDRAVAALRRAEARLGGEIDDWWEAEPRPELPPWLSAEREGPETPEWRAWWRYIGFRVDVEKGLGAFSWPSCNTGERLLEGFRASIGWLEPGLEIEEGDPGAPLGAMGWGEDGAFVCVHWAVGEASEAELERLVVAVSWFRAASREGLGPEGLARTRGYLVAGSFAEGVVERAERAAGVAARVYVPLMEFAEPEGSDFVSGADIEDAAEEVAARAEGNARDREAGANAGPGRPTEAGS